MPAQLKPIQLIIALFIILICLILFITYGKTSFASLTERPGFYGNLYLYYRVDRIAFGIYNLFIALITGSIIILQIKSISKGDKAIFKKGSLLFVGLAILLILAEIYLQMSFQGKG